MDSSRTGFRTQLDRRARIVAIDLEGVLLVDREVVQFLAVTEKSGVELRSCPNYIREGIVRE